MTTLLRLIVASQAMLMASCAHVPAPTVAKQVQQEPRFDCVAEVVEVKQEAWQFRQGTYSTNDMVRQGTMVISLRMRSPAARAGEVYHLGVYEESEVVIGGRSLVRGDVVQFRATEGVLQRWVVPEVFSNLEEVGRVGASGSGAALKSSPGQPITSP